MYKIFVFTIFSLLCVYLLTADDDHQYPSTYVFPAYKHTYGIRKAGPTELFLFMGLRVKFRNPQGLACVRLEAWEDPNTPHDDDEVTVYGVNSGQNNIIYNSSMWGLGVYWGERDEEKLNAPNGICANRLGDVYIADSGNHRIVRLFNPGNELNFVSAIGSEGGAPGQFRYPKQVAMDPVGNIYVSDTGNSRIQVFDKDNKLIKIFAQNGEILSPDGIAVAHSLERHRYRADNFIIIIDSLDQRINKFNPDGKLLGRLNTASIGYTNARLEYVVLDYYNQIHITDAQNHCIHKFDKELNYICSFGSKGDDDYQFEEPRGITMYRRFGQIFIAEKSGAQYYWIGTDIKDLAFFDRENSVMFNFFLTEPSYVFADIYDSDGRFVKRIADKQFLYPAGKHKIFWNLRLSRKVPEQHVDEEVMLSSRASPGSFVPFGKYMLHIMAEATYSSRTYFMKHKKLPFSAGRRP